MASVPPATEADSPGRCADAWQRHPAFSPYRALAQACAADFPDGARLTALAAARGVRNGQGVAVGFSAPSETLKAADYELRIWRTGTVPVDLSTRHDRLNALVWLTFPRFKAALNASHARTLLAEPGEALRRGRRRDALTLLDEMGLLVTGPADLLQCLAARAWQDLFVRQRERVKTQMSFTAVGHGLMEKALAPYPALTAKCLLLEAAPAPGLPDLDAAAALTLRRIASPAQLPPLPICGIPGWSDANARAGFYDDPAIFRPPPGG